MNYFVELTDKEIAIIKLALDGSLYINYNNGSYHKSIHDKLNNAVKVKNRTMDDYTKWYRYAEAMEDDGK